MEFGKITKVSLRDLWPSEATHFTPWLANNLNVLSEKLGMDLNLESVEASAGDFSADIVAKDLSTNRTVVIENQFGGTDHRHLGQIITYSSVLKAGIVIWISETIRQEHKSAIDFLNQNLKAGLQIYALEAVVIKIDNSKPAFDFKVVCFPSPDLAGETSTSTVPSETREKYRAYFQRLIDELREKHQFTNAKIGQPQSWYAFASENSKNYVYSTSFAQGERVRVEIYIDCRDKPRNKAIFDQLAEKKGSIESEINETLSWERIDERRACRIAVYRDGSIDVDTETLEEIRQWAINQLISFRKIFPKYIAAAIKAVDVVTVDA